MKKLQGKTLLALLLLLAMSAALFCPVALADSIVTGNAGEVGAYFVKTLVRYADYTVKLTETVGTVPPGIEISDGDALVAFGTPSAPGTYACTLHFQMIGREAGTESKEGTFEFTMNVTGEPAATPTPAPTPAPVQTPVPADAKLPVIYKSPTDETVDIGKKAEFVARFDNAIWARWHFVSPDGLTDYVYNEIPKGTFPGLVIINGDKSHLVLKSIPYELNGWRVYCLYGNHDGTTPTGSALITVNPPPSTPTPAPTPTPTPSPTPVPALSTASDAGGTGAAPSTPPVSETVNGASPGSPAGSQTVNGVSPDSPADSGTSVVPSTPKPVQAEKTGGVSVVTIAVIVVIVLLLCAAAAWYFLRGRGGEAVVTDEKGYTPKH